MIGEGTPTPSRLGDYTGRHFEEGVAIQTPVLGVVRNREGAGGGGMTDPHRWRGDGVWMGLKIQELKSDDYILRCRREQRQHIEYRR